jgi:hypothetical protein
MTSTTDKEPLWSAWNETRFPTFSCISHKYCRNGSRKCSILYTWGVRKIWGFHGRDYEECRLLGYKIPVLTSQETHYFPATESSRLMLCKFWCFHGSDYEECRFLGYKTPVHTSQETYYVSATDSSRLMLCKFWGFHGGGYEERRFLGCYAMFLL